MEQQPTGRDEVLTAIRRLLEEPRFQDVHFLCSDGRLVSSNRAFLAARCEYFERLLFGAFKESTSHESSSEIRLHASSEAVRHILVHLHTGAYASIEQEACWITLMEASSLAQQYMLPGVVQHIADRLSADLRPENLGLALSYALKADLQAVIKSIWVALPRLLQRPFALDRSFSADAICFCLKHTAWMAPLAASGTSNTCSSITSTAAASTAAATADASGTAANNAPGGGGRGTGSSSSSSSSSSSHHAEAPVTSVRFAAGCRADSSTAQEAQAFNAVLNWMLEEVAGCTECKATRHVVARDSTSTVMPQQHPQVAPDVAARAQRFGWSHCDDSHSPLQHKVSVSGAAGSSCSNSKGVGASGGVSMGRCRSVSPAEQPMQLQHPAMQASSSRQQSPAPVDHAGTAAGLMLSLSSHSVRSSYDSEAGEDTQLPADVTPGAAAAAAGGGGGRFVNPSSSPTAKAPAGASSSTGVDTSSPADAASAGDVAADAAAVEEEVCYGGCCCIGHEAMLLQILAHLNWHLLEPALLDKLESLAMLGPAAMLEIYRAHQRCSHMALWGNFPSLSLGGERGLRCFSTGGEQVLECESVSHLTVTSNLCFTSGKHCWQFVVAVPCDLVWLGLSDGSLQPDVWGGKQPGGWFYGSNDALCHNKQSDRHAYTKHCGNGKWGDGAVVDVCLDMDAREVWFGVDGGEPKLGFTGLPDRVYPAVSLRAPAQLLVRFRACSWLTAE